MVQYIMAMEQDSQLTEPQIIRWPQLDAILAAGEDGSGLWPRSEAFIQDLVGQLNADPATQAKFKNLLYDLKDLFVNGGVIHEASWRVAESESDFQTIEDILIVHGQKIGFAKSYGLEVIKLKDLPSGILDIHVNSDDIRRAFIIGPMASYIGKIGPVFRKGDLDFVSRFGNPKSYSLKMDVHTSSRTVVTAVHASISTSLTAKLASNGIDVKFIPLSTNGTPIMVNIGGAKSPRLANIEKVLSGAMLYFVYLDQKAHNTRTIEAEAIPEP